MHKLVSCIPRFPRSSPAQQQPLLAALVTTSADSGTWSEGGVVGEEELLERGASLHAPEPSRRQSQDGPFGRFAQA